MKKAIVLSGGSIKGAFQAGTLADLLTSNSFIPDVIYWTSVGILNGVFIAERAGRAVSSGNEPNWNVIGNELEEFWLNNITSFKRIGKRIGFFRLAYAVIFKRLKSIIDLSPLYHLVKKEIKLEHLEKSPIHYYACAVNIISGEAVYESVDKGKDIYDYIFASIAIPLVMPYRIIQNECYIDGGIREVAPLRQAIHNDATHIVNIVCHPRTLSRKKLNWKNIIELVERDLEIVTNETLNNDIDHCIQINNLLKYQKVQPVSGPLKNKRNIDLLEIRPKQPIGIELENFDGDQIKSTLLLGKNTSETMLKNCPWMV